MRRRSLLSRVAVPLLAFGLVAAACGGDDGDADETTAPTTTAAPSEAPDTTAPTDSTAGGASTTEAGGASTSAAPGGGVEGCGDAAHTDAADLSADRAVAMCEPGFPAPKPLAEKTKVVISSSAQQANAAWLYVAVQEGEFEKENLDVEIVNLRFAEAIPQMLTGQVQASLGGAEAGWFNAVGQDIPVTWVFGNYIPAHPGDTGVPQTGLWVRRAAFSDPQNPDPKELAGKKLGSAVGSASVIMYPISKALADVGVDLASMEVQQLPAADVLTALENGAVDAAWLLDPTWTQIADNPDYVLLATQPPGETLGGMFFGDQLLNEDREVGLAVLRAAIRTDNTYLQGDWVNDPEVVAKMAEALATTPEAITGTKAAPPVFDWEIRDGTTDRVQAVFEGLGVLEQDPIAEDELVDRSLYLEVVGAE